MGVSGRLHLVWPSNDVTARRAFGRVWLVFFFLHSPTRTCPRRLGHRRRCFRQLYKLEVVSVSGCGGSEGGQRARRALLLGARATTPAPARAESGALRAAAAGTGWAVGGGAVGPVHYERACEKRAEWRGPRGFLEE